LRKGLVIVQFGLTVFLLIGTLVVDKQLRFVRNKNLGIDTHEVVDIMTAVGGGQRGRDMKNAMLANPAVLSISQAVSPGVAPRENTSLSWEGKNPDTVVSFLPVSVDEDYPKVFRTEVAEGRFFSADVLSDRRDAVVVNETAARAMGADSPIGKRLSYRAMNNEGVVENRTLTVIGVMKDFHQTSLHRAITPMLFINNGASLSHQVRLRSSNIAETMKFLEKTWKSFVPNWPYPFTFTFLDDRIDGFYKAERKVRAILGMFSVLALFTACLGLSGLAAFLVERRKKEIGIRKVLGASVRNLVLTQTREFGFWVLLANIIAWPAAYFAVGRWLQGFAYHVRPGVAPALIAAVFSLAVALLAVGYKAFRASLANPIDSLKYE
jgi:putative ABC transport system permease protein